ncbi:MAG: beta-propeller fold lactonase family protein [Terriglobales bacterium]
MRRRAGLCLLLTWLTLSAAFSFAAPPIDTIGYLVTNDDYGQGESNSSTFFTIGSNGALSNPTVVDLDGAGIGGGYFAANRVSSLNTPASPCVYLSQGSTNTIAGVQVSTQTLVGDFSASDIDNGADNGIGMVMNSDYLYASFSTSSTIATFAIQPGCALQFLSDISPSGLNGGAPKGMALSGNLLVVTYGDGSIESFNTSSGLPVSNGDEQNATGYASDDFPDGIVITPDGHYAIFGDDASGAAIEVSDISSGQLTSTILYNLPAGLNSNNVLLSPDGTLLYVSNNTSGQVSAAFFDPASGTVSGSCTSPPLKGFNSAYSFVATLAIAGPGSAGSVLYVAEFGQPSAIGVIDVSASGGQCTLKEASGSPVSSSSDSLLSIAVVSTLPLGLYSPTPGSTLSSSRVTFEWDGPATATAFKLAVGSSAGGSQYYQSGSLSPTSTSATVSMLPSDDSTVYVTLSWLINSSWVVNSYTYTAGDVRQHIGFGSRR